MRKSELNMQQPRVISYARFSSTKQGRGSSLERQTRAAREWCESKGWLLDDEFYDLGVSAYTGKNKKKGDLRVFLNEIEEKHIEPGTYLLIEALDRLSREEIFEALELLKKILKAGVVIVTLTDGKEWTAEGMKDLSDFMLSIMLLARAHEESRMKAKRLRATFDGAREKQSNQQFGSAPGWLTRTAKDQPWTVIEDRAESVRRVFELAAQGYGSKAIAKQANAEKWPVPTRDTVDKPQIWHSTMAGRLLRFREVLGEHEYWITGHDAKAESEHWKGRSSGLIVKDFYPRIISDELWHRARASIETRETGNRRRDENYFNIWSGLLRCGVCGAPIQRKTELRGWSRAQLICSNKLVGITSCKTGAASKTDASLLVGISAFAGAALGVGCNKELVNREIDVATSKLLENERASDAVATALAQLSDMPALMKKATELNNERKQLERSIQKNRQLLATETNSMLDDSFARSVMSSLYEKSDAAKQLRADCNTKLKRAVSVIWHFAYDVAIVEYKFENVRQTIALGTKVDGASRPRLQEALAGDLVLPEVAPLG